MGRFGCIQLSFLKELGVVIKRMGLMEVAQVVSPVVESETCWGSLRSKANLAWI